jgi:hypothetical protein
VAGAVQSYQNAGGNFQPPANATPQAKGFLGRLLDMDPNAEAQMRGSLGAGLKSVGQNWNKPGLAAFAGSAGAGIEGGKTAADKTTEQQSKFLTQQQAANTSASTIGLNTAKAKEALANATDKMAGGKASVMNSQQQLYLRAMGLVNNDPEVKLAKSTYESALKETGDPESQQAKAAQKAHSDLVQAKIKAHLGALGLDPAMAERLGKMPGSTQDNPVPKDGLSQQKFDQLPVGAYFVNPKDGRVLIKAAPAGGAAPQGPQSPPQPPPAAGTPPTPPLPPRRVVDEPEAATTGEGND